MNHNDLFPYQQLSVLTGESLASKTKREVWIGKCGLQNLKTKVRMEPGMSVVLFSLSVVSDSLQAHEEQHARPPCPSPSPRACSNSRLSSHSSHPTISSSVGPFSRLQSFPASGSFPMSQLFTSGGQSIGASASASVLPTHIQGWIP